MNGMVLQYVTIYSKTSDACFTINVMVWNVDWNVDYYFLYYNSFQLYSCCVILSLLLL